MHCACEHVPQYAWSVTKCVCLYTHVHTNLMMSLAIYDNTEFLWHRHLIRFFSLISEVQDGAKSWLLIWALMLVSKLIFVIASSAVVDLVVANCGWV